METAPYHTLCTLRDDVGRLMEQIDTQRDSGEINRERKIDR